MPSQFSQFSSTSFSSVQFSSFISFRPSHFVQFGSKRLRLKLKARVVCHATVGLTAKEKRQRDKDVGRPKRETTSAEERDKPVQEDPPPFDESDVTEICALSCFGWGMSGRSFCWRLLFSVCVCGLRGVAGPFGCHLSSIRALLLAVCALLLAVCFFSEWSGLVGVDWLTVVLFCCLVLDNRRCCAESRPASVDPWAEVGEVRHCRICVADQRLACG